MRDLSAVPPYSYRTDPAVQPFPDERPLIVFDDVCILCSGFARFVARHDPNGRFRFTMASSHLGQALFRHYGLDPVNYETNLLVVDGRAYGKLAAFAGIMTRLGGGWRLAGLVRVLPAKPVDWLYDRIAQNRYGLFGKSENCMVPDADWRSRVID